MTCVTDFYRPGMYLRPQQEKVMAPMAKPAVREKFAPLLKTYFVERRWDKLRVTVPVDWYITFDGAGACLRLFDHAGETRAAFTDVLSCRDPAITVASIRSRFTNPNPEVTRVQR